MKAVCVQFFSMLCKLTEKRQKKKRAEEQKGVGRGGDSEAEINALPLVLGWVGGGWV